MRDDIAPPPHIPEPGFYYHYKHDPKEPEENYAYELLAVGRHTEEGSFVAVYRPLYEEALAYRLGRLYDIRPLEMFMETVVKDGREVARFSRITDPARIERFRERARKMYP